MPVSLSQRQNFMLDSSAMASTSHSYERRGKVRPVAVGPVRRCVRVPVCGAVLSSLCPAVGNAAQVFNDPVHGHIYLSGMACDIIGAPQPHTRLLRGFGVACVGTHSSPPREARPL